MGMKSKQLPELIHRSYIAETRVSPSEHENTATIQGRAVVFGKMTDLGYFFEEIAPGALDNTDLTDVRFLVNHDLNRIPLARSRNNNENSTLKLIKSAEGLDIEAIVDIENNQDARALVSAITRGDISGMSFMFSIDGEEWKDLDSEKPIRRITSIKSIVECSAVTFPAYKETSISARSERELESLKATLESARAEQRDRDRAPEGAAASQLDPELRILNLIYHK